MIYLSTGGFQNLAPQSVIQKFNEQGIKSIELSEENMLLRRKLLNFKKKK